MIVAGAVISSFVFENVRRNTMEKLTLSTVSVRNVIEHAAEVAIRNHLTTIAQTNIVLLEGLAEEARAGRITEEEAQRRGAAMLLRQPVGTHGYVYVLSGKGLVLAHPDAELDQADLSEQAFIRQQMAQKTGYFEYEWQNPDEPRPRPKALAMLYFEPWDWIVSVSSHREDFSFLVKDLPLGLQSQRFGKTGYAFVVTGQGDVLLHPWLSGNVHSFADPAIKAVFDRIVAEKKGLFVYEWKDRGENIPKKKIVFFESIPRLDWIVASTVYEEEIFEPLTQLGWMIALIVLCTLALTIPLSLYFGSLITTPLSRLARQMQQAAAGDGDVRAEERALGEIGVLGCHFNYYIDRLRRSNEKIRAEIGDRIQAEQQLIVYRKAVENALEGIAITDPGANILAVNRAFTEITGYVPEEVVGRNCRMLQSGRHDREFYRFLWGSLLRTGRWTGEIWNRRKSGEIYPETLSISAIRDQEGVPSHYVAVFHDITETKRQEERIVHQAFHDTLTGLPNRRLAHDRIEVSIAHVKRGGTKLAVLFLDLDNFKNVNDTLGHEWGDKLLLQVANRLVAMVREEDTVARLGGDEFLILVAAIASEEMVIELVKRLLRSFAAPFNVDGNDLFVTASIGVAFFPNDGDNPGILTKHADIAMYQAKARGKNSYCLFTSDLSERISFLRELENNLRQAVINREFTVFYQPKIDPYTKTVTGAEALVRWRKEDGSIVSPADFIPLAEETGLIVPLGEQVLEASCQMLHALNRRGHTDLTISVNLSPLQFVQTNLVDRIVAILAKHAVSSKQLELEITETAMMTNLAKTVETLNHLVDAGFAISIDDFGTGYSSLSYLKKFPIRTLKIDRAFIRDLPHDASDAQLVETIILMAHNLGIGVVAEGVESAEQLEWLKRCGCEQIQGFFYSKPLTAEEFFAYIEAGPAPSHLLPAGQAP